MTKVSVLAMVLCGASMMAFGQQAQNAAHDQYPELPAGPGKDTTVRVCSKCHSPDNVLTNGQDRSGWEATITKMAEFGAVATDDEFSEILDYLTKNFPPSTGQVHVNQATSAELAAGLGLTTAEADAVVDYRKKNGDFKTMDDLRKVPNVDAKKLDAKKDKIVY